MTTEPVTIKAECLKRLSVIDKSFLQIEDETQLMTVAGAWVFEEAPDLDLLRADLARWVGMFPVFKSRLNGDLWEESPDFDIEQHFTVSTLPGPGGKQELEAYLGQLMSLPFDLSRPLWRANLIQGFNGKGAVYFVALHHCISDGQGAIRMVLSLTTSSEEEKISGAGHTMKPKHERSHAPHDGKKPRFNHRFIEPIRHRVASLPKGAQLVGAFQQLHVFTFLALLFTFLDAFFFRLFALLHMALKWVMFVISPKKVFIKEGGTQKQVAYSDLLDLEEVKAVGRACGATLNDVLMANLTSTVRKYLQSTGELHKEKELSCIVPASVRAPEDWQLGNKVCILLLQLPIHIEDPIERLKEVKKRLDEIKAANEVSISYLSMLVGLRLVPKFIFEPLVQIFTRKYHILLTNVPGPRHEISFAGRTVKEYYTFVPQPSKGGLGLCVLSYNGKVSLSVNSDLGHIIPNSGSLLKEFKQEFEILKQRVLGASPTAPETSIVKNQETSLETPAAASDVKVERAQSPQADSGFHSEKDSGSDSE